jgi:hypothetical protein
MEKKDKIKRAAGSAATSANIEGRLALKGKRKPPKCMTKDCSDLTSCVGNQRPCSGLFFCSLNFA